MSVLRHLTGNSASPENGDGEKDGCQFKNILLGGGASTEDEDEDGCQS